jgi:alcohol dehydrogenase (cytochrome c)
MAKTLHCCLVLLVAAGAAAVCLGAADGVTDTMIEQAAQDANNVLTVGMGPQGQRYSPLAQINTQTVGRLTPAWVMSLGGEKQRGQEAATLIYNGRMFVTASYSRIYAFDTKTGRKLWKYEARLPEGIMPCCDVVNRGAALYDNLLSSGHWTHTSWRSTRRPARSSGKRRSATTLGATATPLPHSSPRDWR